MDKVTDINPRNNVNRTPLHIAAAYNHKEVWKLIADAIEDKNPEGDINPKGEGGRAPLHLVALNGYLELCKLISTKIEKMT